MISREDRIISKLEFIEYVCENYPQILIEWKNKGAELAVRTPQQQMQQPPGVNLNGNYRDKENF